MFRPHLGVASNGHGGGRERCLTFAVERTWVCAWHWNRHGCVPGITTGMGLCLASFCFMNTFQGPCPRAGGRGVEMGLVEA